MEKVVESLFAYWESKKSLNNNADLKNHLPNEELFNQLANSTDQVLFLVNYLNQNHYLVSNNFNSLFGEKIVEELSQNRLYIYQFLIPEQIVFMKEWTRWLLEIFEKVNFKPAYEHFCFNFSYTRPTDKAKKSLGVKNVAIDYTSAQFPKNVLVFVQDVQPVLIENAPWWMRVKLDEKCEKIYSYHSEKRRFCEGEILSDREIEFLKLSSRDLSLQEIADAMGIAYSTVDNHRKRILAKIGVKDTTMAIEIMKNAGMKL